MTTASTEDRALVQRLYVQVEALHRKEHPTGPFRKWQGFDLYSRHRWTHETCRRFVGECESNGIADEPEARRSPFSINLIDSVVAAKEMLDKAVELYSGKYLLFTWVRETHFRVTWIELKTLAKESDAPTFEALRPDPEPRIFHGEYYAFEGTLFLFGHKHESPLSRSVYLSRTEAKKDKDLLGVVAGASVDKRVFASACYAHALDDEAVYEDKKNILGDQAVDVVRKDYAHVYEALRKHQGVQMDFPRESNT